MVRRAEADAVDRARMAWEHLHGRAWLGADAARLGASAVCVGHGGGGEWGVRGACGRGRAMRREMRRGEGRGEWAWGWGVGWGVALGAP